MERETGGKRRERTERAGKRVREANTQRDRDETKRQKVGGDRESGEESEREGDRPTDRDEGSG